MNAGAPMRWRCYGARGRAARWFVERPSRRILWWRDGQIDKEDQRSLLAQRASSNIDTGEFEHQLVN